MIAKEDKCSYTFSYTDCEGLVTTVTKEYEYDTSWPIVLQTFTEFLEVVTFRGVKDKVSVEDSPYLTEQWEGPVHPPADVFKGYNEDSEEDEDNAGW
jgi:hypothetical protein